MPTSYSPRGAAMLLSDALTHLDLVQPPSLREPVRDILRAGIEVCTSPSLLGRPIQHAIDLAQAIMSTVLTENAT